MNVLVALKVINFFIIILQKNTSKKETWKFLHLGKFYIVYLLHIFYN